MGPIYDAYMPNKLHALVCTGFTYIHTLYLMENILERYLYSCQIYILVCLFESKHCVRFRASCNHHTRLANGVNKITFHFDFN